MVTMSIFSCFSACGSWNASHNQNAQTQNTNAKPVNLANSSTENVVLNYDFSNELSHWYPNFSHGYVVHSPYDYPEAIASKSSAGKFAVLTNRKEIWHCLEQNITRGVVQGATYDVSASVGVSGHVQGFTKVLVSLKIDYEGSSTTHYVNAGWAFVTKYNWEKLTGSFSLSHKATRVVLYVEGPPAGVDILVEYVTVIKSADPGHNQDINPFATENIVCNPQFEDGLRCWFGRDCEIKLCDSTGNTSILPVYGDVFLLATHRQNNNCGVQQDITEKVKRKIPYDFMATVQISGSPKRAVDADVQAILRIQTVRNLQQEVKIVKLRIQDKQWVKLQGKFLINSIPLRATISIEGPPREINILVNNIVIKCSGDCYPSSMPVIEGPEYGVNIIDNNNLNDGINGWFSVGSCTLNYGTGAPLVTPPMATESLGAHEIQSGRYILATNRKQVSSGPAQMITKKLKLFLTYQVSAWVQAGHGTKHNISVKVRLDDRVIQVGGVSADDKNWYEIGGSFRIEEQPSKVMVYFEGPALGVDFMVAGLHIFLVNRRARFAQLKAQTEKVRQREVILKFVGGEDGSMEGVPVVVKQTQHGFPFGSCIGRTSMDNEDLVRFLTENFNWASFESELKWLCLEPEKGSFNFHDADELLEWCTRNQIEIGGHHIFSEKEEKIQCWVRELNEKELMEAMENCLSRVLTRYKRKFRHFAISSEMLHGSFYKKKLGKDIWASTLKKAKELDPDVTLFVNERHVEDGSDVQSCPANYIKHIRDLQELAAPVGGIGIQGHLSSPVGPILCSALDMLGKLGLPIWFTELNVSSLNDHMRAEDLEVVLREVFAHPAVEGIVLQGFWELVMDQKNAHLVNANGKINEAGKKFLDLRKEWTTKVTGCIDRTGEFKFRGFHGRYSVEVYTPSKTVSESFLFDKCDMPFVKSIAL